MLEDMKPPVRVYPCRIRTITLGLSETDQEILIQAVNDHENWPVKTLESELRRRGLSVSEKAISNHRKQRCSCA